LPRLVRSIKSYSSHGEISGQVDDGKAQRAILHMPHKRKVFEPPVAGWPKAVPALDPENPGEEYVCGYAARGVIGVCFARL